MTFSGETLMFGNQTAQTVDFESDPPFEFSWAKEGVLVLRASAWGNTDNTVVADVYWGAPTRGIIRTRAGMTWVKDTGLTATIAGTGGVSTAVSQFLSIPILKSRYMKVVFTLAGTSKSVNLDAWFYGKN